ncbi:MAG TPA: DUF4127 family protein [Candidatus Baltobacteraceae bacterium]|nr:DUF4127 family protein [Candidatus Baltobacteraceae bacterium]
MIVAPIVFVPMDDRPVTLQLPLMLGPIAGRPVLAPPRALLGNYLQPGKPDAIIAWLNGTAPRGGAYVLSSDMLAYGGLTASRVPGPSYLDAYQRLRELDALHSRYSGAWIGVFGTIMRLAPTGVPAWTPYFAPYPAWAYLQQYANLHDPLEPSEEAEAAHLRELIGAPLLEAYLQTRARDYGVDHLLIDKAKAGAIDRLVLGQDDAKPYGLHVPEVDALQRYLASADLGSRASIEPGADELGMSLVAHALARAAHWTPHIAVRYSTPLGAQYQDPLEFTPIGVTIDDLIALCGGVRDDAAPQIVLYVHLPNTGPALDDAFMAAMRGDLDDGRSVAVVDLSFEGSYAQQQAFAQALLSSGLARRLDAYAAWNTDANSTGTALAEAIAAGAGRRLHSYDALAHETFTFMRFVDDVDFHDAVRPDLNDWLAAQGVTDHSLLAPAIAAPTAQRDRALLWNDAEATLAQLYPNLHITAIAITLPWDRTFETGLDVRLAPNL